MQFVSRYLNKIDKKGRVSVPAPFRAILEKEQVTSVYCYPSLDAPALDAGGARLINKIGQLIEGVAPYSDEHDMLATALYGESEQLKVDGDGRMILSERLRQHAGISGEVTFVGLGDKFQMWEPGRFEERRSRARKLVKNPEARELLSAGRRFGGAVEGERE